MVSRSSMEAKYKALANATAKIQVEDLTSSCILSLVSVNHVFYARTKHIEIDYHFVREQVATKRLDIHFISSAY